jgi:hypothetical protein
VTLAVRETLVALLAGLVLLTLGTFDLDLVALRGRVACLVVNRARMSRWGNTGGDEDSVPIMGTTQCRQAGGGR